MKRWTPALTLALLLATACSVAASSAARTPASIRPSARPAPKPTAPTKAPTKIVVIVMENSPYYTISGNPNLPFIDHTIEPHSLSLTNMHADSSPSLPNYVWMTAGQSCGSDGSDSAWNRTCPSLFDQLDKRGISWTVYAEGYRGGPNSCFTGVTSDSASNDYARKHVPPLLFTSTSSGPACTDHVRNFPNDTPADGAPPIDNFTGVRLPSVTYVIPNLCHDMHNASYQCGSAGGGQIAGDTWLAKNWSALIADAGPTGVVVLTWDESDTSDEHIATYIGGDAVKAAAGTTNGRTYDHASTLRAIEDALGLPCLAGACAATPLPLSG